jgi:beta-glucosidase-like glycosyl hydrolase
MRRNTLLFIFFLTVAAGFMGWVRFGFLPIYEQKIAEQTLQQKAELASKVTPPPSSIEQAINSQIQQLTAEQKIEQLIAAPVTLSKNASPSGQFVWAMKHNPGFVTFFGQQVSSSSAQQAVQQLKVPRQPELAVVPLIAVDHEGGRVQRLNGVGFTKLPSQQELCKLPAAEREKLLTQSAGELNKVGINYIFAPVIDLASGSGSLQDRACSDDPNVVKENVKIWHKVWSAANISLVFKHFPGIGKVKEDLHTHQETIEVNSAEKNLFQLFLKSPALGDVMTSHVSVNLPSGLQSCSLSAECLTDLQSLTDTLIFTDALEMKSASKSASDSAELAEGLPEIAVKAILAGNDVLVFGSGVDTTDLDKVIGRLTWEYSQSDAFRLKVDNSLHKILDTKLQQSGQKE